MSYQACYIVEVQRASLCFRAFGNGRSIQINKLVSKLYPCIFGEEQERVWMPLHVVIYWVGSSFLSKVGMPSYNQDVSGKWPHGLLKIKKKKKKREGET